MALPVAGGVCSTLVLFSMFVVPAYPLLTRGDADVPTILKTPVAVKSMAPFSVGDTDVVVDVVVDEQGRMMDYAIVAGASVLANAQTRRRLENALVFSNFTPATSFRPAHDVENAVVVPLQPYRRERVTSGAPLRAAFPGPQIDSGSHRGRGLRRECALQ